MTARDLLIQHEEERQFPYDDATGKPLKKGDTIIGNITIGVGRNLFAEGTNKSEYMQLLDNDIERISIALDSKIPWWRSMTPDRQSVFINMAFQMGVAGFLNFRDTLELCRVGHYDAASAAGLDSEWARDFPARASQLMAMLRTGAWEASSGG